MKTEDGVMVIRVDKGWGIVHADGHSTSYGWVPLEDAQIYDARYVTKPTDVTYANGPYVSELRRGRVVRVTRTTNVQQHE